MKRLLMTTAIVTGALFFHPTAQAALVDWNFQDHTGLLGNTQTFTSSGINLLARGFDGFDIGTRLFGKNGGGDENGLGLNNDPTGEDEITGRNFIQINVDGPLANRVDNFTFQMASSTDGEKWAVYGSNDAHPFVFTLLASGSDELVTHTLAGGFDNYNFFYNGPSSGVGGANVLIHDFGGTIEPLAAPEPATLAVLGVGIAGLGMAKRRRRV